MNAENSAWARLVSNVLSPPLVWAAVVIPMAFHYADSREQAIIWSLIYAVLVCLVPVLYIFWMVRIGRIGDIHMKERRERFGPFIVSIISTGLSVVLLMQTGAPYMLPLVAIFSAVQLAIMALITLYWQISMHTMSIAGAVVATGLVFGPASALAVSPLVPLVGAARLKLRRHTLAQVIAGIVVGSAVPLMILSLL